MSKIGRSQWFLSRAGQPGGEADCESLLRQQTRSGKPYHWESLGPVNIGGRSTSLVVDPRNPKRVLLGSAGGGVWASNNSGKGWKPLWDNQQSLNIGSLALDPRNPEIVYVGTGEANLTLDSYPGMGLYCKSESHQWERIGRGVRTAGEPPEIPNRIGAIAVDPFSERGHIFIGSATIVDGEMAGLYEGRQLENGGWQWNAISGFSFGDRTNGSTPPPPSPPYRCHSVLFHPAEKDLVFATVNLRGWRSGIWRCRDGQWEQLKIGLPPGEHFGRTSLAIAPSDPNVIWAYAAHRRDSILGVFFSRDMGNTWHCTGTDHFAGAKSTYYTNCIAIHPKHPDRVICGSTDLHRTVDRGRNWEQITEWDLPADNPHYAHADHHALAVVGDGWVYDANDSGLAFSEDFGLSWKTREAGLVTTMFYDMDVAPSDADIISGGAQDNGTLVRNKGDAKGEFFRALGGDGGWTIFDPDDPEHLWASAQHVDISVAVGGEFTGVSPSDLTSEETDEVWMSFLAMDNTPGCPNPRPVFLGTTRIWKTRDDGGSWIAVSPVLDGSTVTAIEVSDANSRYVYAGTERGGVFRSIDGGNTWSENLAGVDLPYRYITRIESHPAHHDHVLLTIGATPSDGGRASYAHIYLSLDAGLTWRSANPRWTLPPVPHNCLSFEAAKPHRVFVGTDLGVYVGNWNESQQNYDWDDMIGDLPNVLITDLVYHAKSKSLTAATYGRGIFRLSLKEPRKRKVEPRAK